MLALGAPDVPAAAAAELLLALNLLGRLGCADAEVAPGGHPQRQQQQQLEALEHCVVGLDRPVGDWDWFGTRR